MSKGQLKWEAESFSEYKEFLGEIKAKVKSSQMKAALAVNRELIQLYWEIGSAVLKKRQGERWGANVVERLAKDLRAAFPNMKGFSFRNVKYMVKFAREYPHLPIGQQAAAQIPWGHNMLILDKISDSKARLWYASKTIEYG